MSEFGTFGPFSKVRLRVEALLLIQIDIGQHLYPLLVWTNTMPVPDEKWGATSHARHESLLAAACALVDV
jgi:hypothetical protein